MVIAVAKPATGGHLGKLTVVTSFDNSILFLQFIAITFAYMM